MLYLNWLFIHEFGEDLEGVYSSIIILFKKK